MKVRTPVDRDYEGKKVHVIGLGAYGTGREVARVLSARGAVVTVSDIKPAAALAGEIAALGDAPVTVQTEDDAYDGMEEAELVVPSPGVPLDIPPLLHARTRGVPVVSEIEVAYWIAPCPIIAVTGTKGKSTTVTLIGELLREAGVDALVGGNIGFPLVALAERATAENMLVAEVSSFQLEATLEFRPRVAVLLNVFPDHLDRHPTLSAYRRAKAKLFANQRREDSAVVNRDDAEAWSLTEGMRATLVPYSTTQPSPEGADVAGGWLRVKGERVCPRDALQLPGAHNVGNALAALAAVHAAGASLGGAGETIARFRGLEHRLETVGEVGGVTFVNDSQATTPEATIAALNAFGGRIVLIAGGRAKVHEFGALAEAAARCDADLVVIGEAADEIAEAGKEAGIEGIARATDLRDAVEVATGRANPGDFVVLSPACASFDMFENMAARGRAFREIVRELAQGKGARR